MLEDMEVLKLYHFMRRRILNHGPFEFEYEALRRQIIDVDKELKSADQTKGIAIDLRRRILGLLWTKYLDGPALITRTLRQQHANKVEQRTCDGFITRKLRAQLKAECPRHWNEKVSFVLTLDNEASIDV